jgi:hypothetical protein
MAETRYGTLAEFRSVIDSLPNPQLALRVVRHLVENGDCWIWRKTSPTVVTNEAKTMSPRRAMLLATGRQDLLHGNVTNICGNNSRGNLCCNPAHAVQSSGALTPFRGKRSSLAPEVARATLDLVRIASFLRRQGVDVEALLRG